MSNDRPSEQPDTEPRGLGCTAVVSHAAWFKIRWTNESWTTEELKKAVEIQTALAWWFAHNEPGTPMPDWAHLSDPIDKVEILELWHEWNAERIAG